MSGLAAWWAIAAGQLILGVVGASVLVMVAMGLAAWPLGRVGADLKVPQERVGMMFDEVRASLATLGSVKAALD